VGAQKVTRKPIHRFPLALSENQGEPTGETKNDQVLSLIWEHGGERNHGCELRTKEGGAGAK
jgi:hypothetical protein